MKGMYGMLWFFASPEPARVPRVEATYETAPHFLKFNTLRSLIKRKTLKTILLASIGLALALDLSAQKLELLKKQVDYPCVLKPKFSKVDEPPMYSGGLVQFKSDLEEAGIVDSETIGALVVSIINNCEGAVAEVEILNGLSSDFDLKLLNVLTELQNWSPGKRRSKPVDSKLRLEIVMSAGDFDVEYSLMK